MKNVLLICEIDSQILNVKWPTNELLIVKVLLNLCFFLFSGGRLHDCIHNYNDRFNCLDNSDRMKEREKFHVKEHLNLNTKMILTYY